MVLAAEELNRSTGQTECPETDPSIYESLCTMLTVKSGKKEGLFDK